MSLKELQDLKERTERYLSWNMRSGSLVHQGGSLNGRPVLTLLERADGQWRPDFAERGTRDVIEDLLQQLPQLIQLAEERLNRD